MLEILCIICLSLYTGLAVTQVFKVKTTVNNTAWVRIPDSLVDAGPRNLDTRAEPHLRHLTVRESILTKDPDPVYNRTDPDPTEHMLY